MVDFAGLLVDPVFAEFGVPAVYRPAAGGSITVSAIVTKGTAETSLFHVDVASHTVVVKVRASDVASPVEGDAIEVGGETLTVQGAPHRDSGGLVWTLDVRNG